MPKMPPTLLKIQRTTRQLGGNALNQIRQFRLEKAKQCVIQEGYKYKTSVNALCPRCCPYQATRNEGKFSWARSASSFFNGDVTCWNYIKTAAIRRAQLL